MKNKLFPDKTPEGPEMFPDENENYNEPEQKLELLDSYGDMELEQITIAQEIFNVPEQSWTHLGKGVENWVGGKGGECQIPVLDQPRYRGGVPRCILYTVDVRLRKKLFNQDNMYTYLLIKLRLENVHNNKFYYTLNSFISFKLESRHVLSFNMDK